MEPTAEALTAHQFMYDHTSLDKPLIEFLQRFYTLSDDRDNANAWAMCFTEDGVMKKAMTNVQGRSVRPPPTISEVNKNSWNGQASRKHTVFKIFSFNPGEPDEVMLYGQSDYVYEDGATGGMGWAARLHFARFPNGNILIGEYHIFPSAPPRTSELCVLNWNKIGLGYQEEDQYNRIEMFDPNFALCVEIRRRV